MTTYEYGEGYLPEIWYQLEGNNKEVPRRKRGWIHPRR